MEDRTLAGRELPQPVFNTGSQVKLLRSRKPNAWVPQVMSTFLDHHTKLPIASPIQKPAMRSNAMIEDFEEIRRLSKFMNFDFHQI
jgi:hypothetical protein